ncbi:MAG: DUF456 domain-containing protein [Candidatus Aenigmatarchaeota archaeon]
MDWFLLLAIILLLAGIIGSFTPLVPAALLSISGILLYWWSTSYTEPGILVITLSLISGTIALLVDWFAGAISAKAGGASSQTTRIAAIAGILLFFIAGPLGIVIGTGLTVFLLEMIETEDHRDSLESAAYAVAGLLASSLMQFLLTVSILVFFLLGILF